jgi:hypothetical protein
VRGNRSMRPSPASPTPSGTRSRSSPSPPTRPSRALSRSQLMVSTSLRRSRSPSTGPRVRMSGSRPVVDASTRKRRSRLRGPSGPMPQPIYFIERLRRAAGRSPTGSRGAPARGRVSLHLRRDLEWFLHREPRGREGHHTEEHAKLEQAASEKQLRRRCLEDQIFGGDADALLAMEAASNGFEHGY